MSATARTFLRRLADKPIPNQRKSRRITCAIACSLFDASGSATAGMILDRSIGGVRVQSDSADVHRGAAFILRMDTGAAYAVRCVWYVGGLAGYEFGRRVDLRFIPRDNAVRALKTAWRAHLKSMRLAASRSVDKGNSYSR